MDGPTGLRNMAALLAVAESHVLGAPVRVADVASGSIHAYQDPIDAALGLLPSPTPKPETVTTNRRNAPLRPAAPT